MGLFNFYNKEKQNGNTMELPQIEANKGGFKIPEDVFIEKGGSSENNLTSSETTSNCLPGNDLSAIYEFVQADYESKGYNDALTNPDDSYRSDNISLFKQDLNILIQKVETTYQDQIRDIEFHIASRERAGLIDLVEQLKSKKQTIETHMTKVQEVRDDALRNQGMCQRMILSYQRGFMRGLAAISRQILK